MNKIIQHMPDGHIKIGFAMNSSSEHQEFLRAVPNPLPNTHQQSVEWGNVGNVHVLWIWPEPHPLEVVAAVTDHFGDIKDAPRLKLLCERAKIEVDKLVVPTSPAEIKQATEEKRPTNIEDAMREALREKIPMPKEGGKPGSKASVFTAPRTVQVKETIVVLPPDIAEMDMRGLEKTAAMAGGINQFMSAKNRGASLASLKAIVVQLREKKRAQENATRQGHASVFNRG